MGAAGDITGGLGAGGRVLASGGSGSEGGGLVRGHLLIVRRHLLLFQVRHLSQFALEDLLQIVIQVHLQLRRQIHDAHALWMRHMNLLQIVHLGQNYINYNIVSSSLQPLITTTEDA